MTEHVAQDKANMKLRVQESGVILVISNKLPIQLTVHGFNVVIEDAAYTTTVLRNGLKRGPFIIPSMFLSKGTVDLPPEAKSR